MAGGWRFEGAYCRYFAYRLVGPCLLQLNATPPPFCRIMSGAELEADMKKKVCALALLHFLCPAPLLPLLARFHRETRSGFARES